ncbi:MAG TPA: hypothetical protein VGH28_33595 [Polyangiaceae bacterium]|jgi:hypothetical protein
MLPRVCGLLLLCAACSLDESGIATTDGGVIPDVMIQDVVVAPDVAQDVVDEPGPPLPCTTDASVCSAAVPGGWSLTAFAPNQTTACPANFTQADVVASPVAAAGACTCDCSVVNQPSCALGNVTMHYASNNQCGTLYMTFDITTEGACTDYNDGTFSLSAYHEYTDLALTPGTCSSNAKPDTTKLSATPVRTCAPPPACAEDLCDGSAPSGMRSCIVGPGDVACPAGPFTDKVAVIGAGASLTCGACAGCSVTASPCGAGTVKFWGDSSCTMAKGSVPADGNCDATGGGTGVNHFTYVNPVQNVQCNAGTSAATASLSSPPQTVCCR